MKIVVFSDGYLKLETLAKSSKTQLFFSQGKKICVFFIFPR
ncbi:hypothetical protein BBR47_58250 [Brevibacillus brevis NBRC 100599]|uniref:Uncharacterized protein n=1 Tax=Brevibacillus brevis (strain 47 / JCM 6285 / NBRC 100599) TaxID=358681 RepID=C0Z9U8_BREBN|nr:hypothetical protein BBR47_58250 [Brevibacillus brevis NBRC 100599]